MHGRILSRRLLPIVCVLLRIFPDIQSVIPNKGPTNLKCHLADPKTFKNAKYRWDEKDEMSIELCIQYCADNEMTLALLYNGESCMCSDIFTIWAEVPAVNCKSKCPGNSGERCGGPDAISIYTICDTIHYYKNCEYVCYCDKYSSCNFMTGVCLNGKCDFYYEGERCDQKRDAPFWKMVNAFLKFLQDFWKKIKGFFVLEKQIPEKCDYGLYGIECKFVCHCASGSGCDRVTGICKVKKCGRGWVGRRCDKPHPCDAAPCLNGGECIINGLKMNCQCKQPYSGKNCEIVDPCFKNPCLNNGICKSKKSAFECECVGDSYGEKCESDLKDIPATHMFVSCFREVEKDRTFLEEMKGLDSSKMAPELCSRRCRGSGYTYAALQLGNQCRCSDSLGLYGGVPSSECGRQCSGDQSKSCGGDQTANSVFTVCPIGHYSVDCKKPCNCLYYPCNLKTGNCPEERCKVGFHGQKCELPLVQPVGDYAKKRLFILMAVIGYAALVVFLTFVLILNLMRIISLASLTGMAPPPTKEKPTEEKAAPEADKKVPKADKLKSKSGKAKRAKTTKKPDEAAAGSNEKKPPQSADTKTSETGDAVATAATPTDTAPEQTPTPAQPPVQNAPVPPPFQHMPMQPTYENMAVQQSYQHMPMQPTYESMAMQPPYGYMPMQPMHPPFGQMPMHLPHNMPPMEHKHDDEDGKKDEDDE